MTAAELEIKVTTNTAQIEKLKAAISTVPSHANNMTSSFFKANIAFAAVEKGIGLVVNKIKESLTAFKAQEQAENKLRTLIGGNISKYSDLASEIQKVTTVGDELSLGSMVLAKTMGVSNEAIGTTTKNAIGLSKAFGVDLQQSTKMAVLASQGNYEALTRFIPALRTTKDLSEQQAIVNKAMADGWNIAQAEANTFSGKLEQLNNSTGDVLEETGRVASVIGIDLVQSLLVGANAFNDWIKSAEGIKKISQVAGVISGIFQTAKDIFFEFGKVIKENVLSIIENLQKNFTKLVGQGHETNAVFNILTGATKLLGMGFSIGIKFINLTITALTNLIKSFLLSGKTIGDFFQFLAGKKSWDEVKKSAGETADAFSILGKDLFNDVSGLVASSIEEFKKFPDDTLKQAEEWSKKYTEIVSKTQKKTADALSGNIESPLLSANGKDIEKATTSQPIKLQLDITSFKSDLSIVANTIGKFQDTLVSSFQNTFNVLSDENSTFAQKFSSVFNAVGQSIVSMLGIVKASFEEFYNDQLEKLSEQHDAEIEAIDERLAREIELITYNGQTKKEFQAQQLADLQQQLLVETDATKKKDLETQISALQKEMAITAAQQKATDEKTKSDQKYAKAKYKTEVEQFNTLKAMEILMATMQYLMGLVTIWSTAFQLGPIAGAIMGGVLTGVLSGIFAASVATIASKQPPPPPKFASGTNFAPGGMALVGERGAELMNVPRGSQITPADQTEALLSRPIILQDRLVIDGYQFAEVVRRINVRNQEVERSR